MNAMAKMGACACGEHVWALLTKGYVTLVAPEDAHIVRSHAFQARVQRGVVYAMRSPASGAVYLHRLVVGAAAGEEADHCNGNSLDNRSNNLRRCTRIDNAKNVRRHRDAASRFKGVNFRYGRWRAAICVDRHQIHLGYHSTEADAARAYDVAARRYHGDFARVNFPEVQP